MRVIVVEDDPIVSRRMQQVISKHGHRVQAVQTCAAAENCLQEGVYDCAVIDWMLPDGNGLDLIRRVREQSHDRYLYTIMLTSMKGIEHRREGMEAGADDFLSKPLNTEDLLLRLRVAVRITELQHQLADRNQELARTKRRLEEDVMSAAKVQRDLLPADDFAFPSAQISWYLQSCEALGGDLVALTAIDDRHLGFAVIDVVGHGAKAAILGVQISRRLRSSWTSGSKWGANISHEVLTRPSQLARLLNDEFPMDYRNLQFFTMCYGVLNTLDGHCDYVGCGHPAPLRIDREGVVHELPVSGHPIGVLDDDEAVFTEFHITLEAGENLVLMSDGLPECLSPSGEMLGKGKIHSALTGEREPQAILDRLSQRTAAWRGHDILQDDCTALVIKRLG